MNNDSMNKQELNEEELDTVAGGIWEIYHESTEIKPGSFVQKKVILRSRLGNKRNRCLPRWTRNVRDIIK